MPTIGNPSVARELVERVSTMPIRILSSDATEEPGFSTHRLRCKIRRENVEDGALAVMFAVAALSFNDARPRGTSYIEYVERDEWTADDLCRYLRYVNGALRLDADYVRGRMMKTVVTARPTGVIEIVTRNRHQMAIRWIETLKGNRHLRLVVEHTEPPEPS